MDRTQVGTATVAAVAVVLIAVLIDRPHSSRSRVCTRIGCSETTEVLFDLANFAGAKAPAPDAMARMCVGVRCVKGHLAEPGEGEGRWAMDLDDSSPTIVDISVSITDAAGHVLISERLDQAATREYYPNGPDCPPACRDVLIRLEDSGLVAVGDGRGAVARN